MDLPEPWLLLDDMPELRLTLEQELLREVASEHQLHGLPMDAIAKCGACDEALFAGAGQWALVHLTFRQKPETAPFPLSRTFRDSSPARAAAVEHAEGH